MVYIEVVVKDLMMIGRLGWSERVLLWKNA